MAVGGERRSAHRHPDATRLGLVDSWTASLLDAATGTHVADMGDKAAGLSPLAWSPTGRSLVMYGGDQLMIWEMPA